MKRDKGRREFLFLGNALWLDLVNTEVMDRGERRDLLSGFDEVLAWAAEAGTVERKRLPELARKWPPAARRRGLEQVAAFRKSLRRMAEELEQGRRVPSGTLEAINELLARPVERQEVVRRQRVFEKRPVFEPREPADLVAPVARSAADTLVTGDLSLIKKCGNPGCVLHFYDNTKNHRRRWCSMAACGNREKVAAFLLRQRVKG